MNIYKETGRCPKLIFHPWGPPPVGEGSHWTTPSEQEVDAVRRALPTLPRAFRSGHVVHFTPEGRLIAAYELRHPEYPRMSGAARPPKTAPAVPDPWWHVIVSALLFLIGAAVITLAAASMKG